MLFNKHIETSQELIDNLTKLTGFKETDMRILIDCIANELFNLVIFKNKAIKFGCLGTFDSAYEKKSKKYKIPKKTIKKKLITFKNSKVVLDAAKEALKLDKEKYENRIIWK